MYNNSIDERIKKIKLASWIGIGGNAFLAIFKIVAGIVAGSLSVVADGIDSSGDTLISVMTLYIAYLLSKPPNLKFPYGCLSSFFSQGHNWLFHR